MQQPSPDHHRKQRAGALRAAPGPRPPASITGPAAATDGCRNMVYRRGEQLWTFRWDTGCERQLVQAITSLADDDDCPFDWVDAAVVCHCLGQTAAVPAAPAPPSPET